LTRKSIQLTILGFRGVKFQISCLGFTISRGPRSRRSKGALKSQRLRAHRSFVKSGFGNQGNELLDIATAEIVIRRNPKQGRKGSELTVFGFSEIEKQYARPLDSQKGEVRSPEEKGGFHELIMGADFLKGE
jgi:hypothetical protein